jgi:signal transduction histidine kinase
MLTSSDESVIVPILKSIGAYVYLIDVLEDGTFRFFAINWTEDKELGMIYSGTITGKRPEEVFQADRAERLNEHYKLCLERRSSIEFEGSYETASGKHWATHFLAPLFDLNGQIVRIMGTVVDITERKRIEGELKRHQEELKDLVKEKTSELTQTNEQLQSEIIEHRKADERKAQLLKELESVNQELKDFAYVVSHDLKAPLRSITTLANWLAVDYKDKLVGKGIEQLNMLIARASRLNVLINGILEYSRLGRIKERKIKLNTGEIVSEVIEILAPPENIIITVENELPSITFEKYRLIEVFQNLLSNAIKYMDKPQGTIKVGCVGDGEDWKFSVSDNGPGIEHKYFEKIFQIFQTLSPDDEQESTGIGLSLVKKIITTNGGKVWVESDYGHGSKFFFTLPKKINNNQEKMEVGHEKQSLDTSC